MKKVLFFTLALLLMTATFAPVKEVKTEEPVVAPEEETRPLEPLLNNLRQLQSTFEGIELNGTQLESINSKIAESEKIQKAFSKLDGTKLNFLLEYNDESIVEMMILFGENGFDKLLFETDSLAGTNKNNILVKIDLYNMESLIVDVMGMFEKTPGLIDLVKFYFKSNLIVLKVLVSGDISIKPFTAILKIVPIIFVIISLKEITGGIL